ncbi:hypothetical protein EDB81DRAFT_905588 [Dactylonectria macrodidyma]|uniref:Major facilitator superfamily (MFS) profile domain-containing protein n=1 Tax=Dactylonectria macrodidyma TaxID=307937 RepID=A0A9P9E5G2_9HYPO|nr:hypothetical protein EDB81DRAFT_905588 [Dactylonectria macrodidyma]
MDSEKRDTSIGDPKTSAVPQTAQIGEQVEAPVTWKAYLLCSFASFGGIFFGYDSGYINGVSSAKIFIEAVEGAGTTELSYSNSSLITIGLLFASVVVYGTESRTDTSSYRIPIAIQFPWAVILRGGILFLPGSPRYFVKKGNLPAATASLSHLRGQPEDSAFVQSELAEIVANEEYERALIPSSSWVGSWANCFKGSLRKPNSNLRRTVLGTGLHMMQQWTGVNFIFYYSTPFLKSTAAISNSFLISLVFTLVNRFGRRTILIVGAAGMSICQFLVAIIGVTIGFNHTHPNPANPSTDLANNIAAVNAQIAFIAIFIFWFASTWGPASWVVVGEVFPLPIRSRGVALSTASNWLWNAIIALITPYMVHEDKGNMKSSVFFVWGTLCATATVFAYLLVPETKGLTLEQVDKMMEENTPRTSAKWKPTTTFASGANTKDRSPDDGVVAEIEYGDSDV